MKGYKINIKHPVYCILNSDTAEGVGYDVVKDFGEAQEVGITPSVATGSLYGNGDQVDNVSKLSAITISYKTTKVSQEAKKDIFNLEVQDGVLITKAGQVAKYIAFGYEVELSNGKSQYVWLLKGRPVPMNETNTQSEDNIKYSTDTLEISFIRREYDKALKYDAEVGEMGFTEEQANKWFLNGPTAPVTKDGVKTVETESGQS